MDPTSLFVGMIFSTIGAGYAVYGKKQSKAIALFSGIMLCILPFFMANMILLTIVSLLLMAAPFFIQF